MYIEPAWLLSLRQDGHSQSMIALPGSGKSSALRLIFRFYDPTSGAVFIDGQNIADVTQVSHPAHTAMQLQTLQAVLQAS